MALVLAVLSVKLSRLWTNILLAQPLNLVIKTYVYCQFKYYHYFAIDF